MGKGLTQGAENGSEAPAEAAVGLAARIAEVATRALPVDSVVLVAGDDDAFSSLNGIELWRFPPGKDQEGAILADGAEAIRQLEALRLRGAGYFLLPCSAFSWLDRYRELSDHLRERHRLVVASEACLLFSLESGEGAGPDGAHSKDGLAVQLEDLLDRLLPDDAVVAVVNVAGEGPKPPGSRIWSPALAAGDFTAAAAQVEALRAGGVEYLVIPCSAFGWSDRHPELIKHLTCHHRFVTRQENVCKIFAL
jgi:hypothetical protein